MGRCGLAGPSGGEASLGQRMFGRHGLRGFLERLFSPVLVPVLIVPAWLRSLWACRELLWGRWSRYPSCHLQTAMDFQFYRCQWINLDRYGRLGRSPIAGLGDFPLSNWWHLSALASGLFVQAGAVAALLGTLFMAASHLVWAQAVPPGWAMAVTLALVFSSTAYVMAFARQNYQVLGWMWLPLALYGLLHGQPWLAALGFLLAGFLSVTAFSVSVPLVAMQAIRAGSPLLALVLAPAATAVLFRFAANLRAGGLLKSMVQIGKAIGLVRSRVRYRRTSMVLGPFNRYFLAIYAAGTAMMWHGTARPPALALLALVIFLVNQRFVRFADEESVMTLFFLCSAAEALLHPGSWWSLGGLVLANNPLPYWFDCGFLARPKTYAPCDLEPLFRELRAFLDLPGGSRVLIAFADPGDSYEKVFDGYRHLLEPPLAVAAEREVHLFPDWNAVFETNYEGAPSFWGRGLEEVRANLDRWRADYAIVYRDAGTPLEPEWLEAFQVVGSFDWTPYVDGHKERYTLLSRRTPTPAWWLLRLRGACPAAKGSPGAGCGPGRNGGR